MDRGGTGMRLAMVLAIAIAARVSAACVIQLSLPPGQLDVIAGDAEGYIDLAGDIAQGREYSIYTPPRRVMRMPGFPALLALCERLFGPWPLMKRLVLACVGTLGCAAVYALGRILFDERVAIIGTAITAMLPSFVGFTPLFLSETAFAVTLVASLIPAAALLLGLSRRDSSNSRTLCRAGSCGALIGLACYMRPSWLLWAPFVAALAIIAGRARGIAWIAGVVIGAATFLTLVPWALRNQRVTGHFVLTTLWMGPSLYDGLNPDATGDSEMSFFDRENLMGQMSEYDVNREYARRAREFAWNNPGRAIALGFKKLGRYWSLWPNAGQFKSWKHWALMLASSLPLFAATLIGLWRYRTNWIVLALTLGPVLYFAAVHAVFVGSIRYRLPAEYPMTLLAAAGLIALFDRQRSPRPDQACHPTGH